MKLRFFTFLVSFLTVLSGAVWGQEYYDSSRKEPIIVNDGSIHNITLNGVNIDKRDGGCAFSITNNSTVNLTLKGDNVLFSDENNAGIYVEVGSALIIDGEGSLQARSQWTYQFGEITEEHTRGAGIGGSESNPSFGTIWIKGGNITTQSYTESIGYHADGAGIGGGSKGDGGGSTEGTVIITGGNVTAECIDTRGTTTAQGAAIGGGYKGTCTSVAILGGNVTLNSKDAYNIGIGNGFSGSHPSIIIGSYDGKNNPVLTHKILDKQIDETNFLNAATGNFTVQKLEGNPVLPKNAKIKITNWGSFSENLKAYKITYASKQLGDNCTSSEDLVDYQNFYYGPETNVEIPKITCPNHSLLGWISPDKPEAIVDAYTTGNSISGTTPEEKEFTAVWVEKIHYMTIKHNEAFTSTPLVISENAPVDVVFNYDGLKEFIEDGAKAEKVGSEWYVKGTAKQITKDYVTGNATCIVMPKGALKNGNAELKAEIDMPFYISQTGQMTINSVTLNTNADYYTAMSHNDHALIVKAENNPNQLKEGVHYVIEKFKFNSADKTATTDGVEFNGHKTLIIKDAGTYSEIQIKAINGNLLSQELQQQGGGDNTVSKPLGSITINPATLTVTPKNVTIKDTEDAPTEFDFEVKGLQGNEKLTVNKTGFTIDPSFEKGKAPMRYTIKYSIDGSNLSGTDGFDKDNYTLQKPEGFLNVRKGIDVNNINITWENTTSTATYNGLEVNKVAKITCTNAASSFEQIYPDSNYDKYVDITYVKDGENTGKTSIKDAGKYTKVRISIDDVHPMFYITGEYIEKDIVVNTSDNITVEKATLQLKATDQTITLGSKANKTPEYGKTIELVGGESLVNDEEPAFTGELLVSKENEVGEHIGAITKGTVAFSTNGEFNPDNYKELALTSGNLNVTNDDIEIEIPGEGDDEVNFTYSREYNGESFKIKSIKIKDVVLTEGNGYNLGDYRKDGSVFNDVDNKWGVGTYKVDATINHGNYSNLTITITIKVTEKPLNVQLKNNIEIELGNELTMFDVFDFKSLVKNEIPTIDPNPWFEGDISSEGVHTVILKKISLKDNPEMGFEVKNYNITYGGSGSWNNSGNTEIEVEVTDPNDDGGPGIISYHDLHITESVGAKLVSRNGKDRTPDGGSFTLSLEKEEGYEDCEPTVYYKRGRFGEWKELKLDEVSGYYQIRSVYTDIYVKVSGDGIWPVSNEEVEAQEVKVYTQNGAIVVVTPSVMDVQVVSMTGSVVAADKVAGQREFRNLVEGVYIVRVGDKIVKVRL